MEIGKLHYITNGQSEAEILMEVAEVIESGVEWIQLRIKNPDLDVRNVGLKVRELCKGQVTFILNDYVEIAKEIDADGVHLGLEDMPVSDARKIVGFSKIIGGTANTLDDCLERQKSGVDYIGLGPFRETTTKKKLSPILGLSGYAAILPKRDGEIKVPTIAIGGIREADISEIMEKTAVYGIAVSGLISRATDKKKLISRLKEALEIAAEV